MSIFQKFIRSKMESECNASNFVEQVISDANLQSNSTSETPSSAIRGNPYEIMHRSESSVNYFTANSSGENSNKIDNSENQSSHGSSKSSPRNYFESQDDIHLNHLEKLDFNQSDESLALIQQENIFKLTFPYKLYVMLKYEDEKIIRWLDSGLAFRIEDMNKFCSDLLPKYFKHSKANSFQRQLNLYGFRHVTVVERNFNVGAFFHENFRRDGRKSLALVSLSCDSCDLRRQYVMEPVASENQAVKGRKNKQQLSNIVAKAQIMAEKNPEIFFDPPNGSSIEPVMQLDESAILLLTKQLSNQTNKARAQAHAQLQKQIQMHEHVASLESSIPSAGANLAEQPPPLKIIASATSPRSNITSQNQAIQLLSTLPPLRIPEQFAPPIAHADSNANSMSANTNDDSESSKKRQNELSGDEGQESINSKVPRLVDTTSFLGQDMGHGSSPSHGHNHSHVSSQTASPCDRDTLSCVSYASNPNQPSINTATSKPSPKKIVKNKKLVSFPEPQALPQFDPISRATMIRAAFRAITETLPTASSTITEGSLSPIHSPPEPEEHEGDRLKTLCDLCSAADDIDDISVDLTTVASGSHTVNSSNYGISSNYH